MHPRPLECQKPLFALPEGETRLNNAYMGAMPRSVLEAGHRAVDLRALPAAITPADFFAPAERVRGPVRRVGAGKPGAGRPGAHGGRWNGGGHGQPVSARWTERCHTR